MDIRRRWSCAAAVVTDGKGAIGAPDVLLLRPKMLLKVLVEAIPQPHSLPDAYHLEHKLGDL